MGVFIVIANIIGFIFTEKEKHIYCYFYNISMSSFIRAIGGLLALFVVRDGFAIFCGMQLSTIFIVGWYHGFSLLQF